MRLLGVLAERDGKGLAVFRTREGARVVAAGGEVTAGTTLVAVDVSSVRLRDAAGERTVDLRRDPVAKAAAPAARPAATPKSTDSTDRRRPDGRVRGLRGAARVLGADAEAPR
ncbi:MAG: hypothetical protein IPF73_01710 [Betaproteobacteria bacterium]|nr:hypothetical protein [Betaproteobacteria bacterium]